MKMINLFFRKAFNGGVNGPVTAGVTGGVNGYAPDTPETDITPDPVNWGNTDWNASTSNGTNNSAQITGINSTLTLTPTFTGAGLFFYKVSNSPIAATDYQNNSGTWSAMTTGMSIQVTNNQYVGFMRTAATQRADVTVTIKDQVLNTLDTFVCVVYEEI
jgi:hypothetical protein